MGYPYRVLISHGLEMNEAVTARLHICCRLTKMDWGKLLNVLSGLDWIVQITVVLSRLCFRLCHFHTPLWLDR